MSEPTPAQSHPLESGAAPQAPLEPAAHPAGAGNGSGPHPAGSSPPGTPWPAWTAAVALLGALVLATLGGLLVEIPAAALGVKISSSHMPPGVVIADTFIQDVAFVAAAVFCAQLGGRVARPWQFGLRPPVAGWWSAVKMVLLLLVAFLVFSAVWALAFHPGKEKLLEQLGSNEGAGLLVLSAGLTCVVAPIGEEMLFRGFIFTALRSWRGTAPAALIAGILFGAVHAGSAPAVYLVPLAALGVGLCLLYRRTGSIYPCFVAHSLNNSVAFSLMENWSWQIPVLVVSALAGIWAVVLVAKRVGLISPEPVLVGSGA